MLTRVRIRNFKRFAEADIELGKSVVLIGPNNCGKTTVLQALALWDIGVKRWLEKRGGKQTPEKRPGVTINRNDLIPVPVPVANLLWRDLRVRDVRRVGGAQRTQNIRIEIMVEGISEGRTWVCGLEFDYANDESFYCRPLRTTEGRNPQRMEVPVAAGAMKVAYLPPMSGLAARERKIERGGINVLIGEGRTAEALRNLCWQLVTDENGSRDWEELVGRVESLFGVTLEMPQYVAERGELAMSYQEGRTRLDLSAAGRGLQQTLLLLAYLYVNPGAVLLLDEPDAHLEILRQRQIYQMLTQTAEQKGGQVIAASHSEVILQEAAERDIVMGFLGAEPHRINDRGSQLLKSLRDIDFEDYMLAQQRGWVLYLEGSTDRAILKAFADTLGHPAAGLLERPFVHYVKNAPAVAESHFGGLCEAKPDLVGVGVFDRLDGKRLQQSDQLQMLTWTRREIENYLCYPEVLLKYAEAGQSADLFGYAEAQRRREAMRDAIEDVVPRAAHRDPTHTWWSDVKASDSFLDEVFDTFYKRLGLPDLMRKSNYHQLARLVPKELIVDEVREKLDAIVECSRRARPAAGEG